MFWNCDWRSSSFVDNLFNSVESHGALFPPSKAFVCGYFGLKSVKRNPDKNILIPKNLTIETEKSSSIEIVDFISNTMTMFTLKCRIKLLIKAKVSKRRNNICVI